MIGLVKSQRVPVIMKRYRRTTASQYLVVVIILVSVIGLGFLSAFLMSQVAFTDYFVLPWAAGRAWLLDGINPYELSVIDQASSTIENSPYLANLPDSPVLTQPLLSLIYYLPFSLIPYTISRVLWATLLSMCVGLIGFMSIRLVGWKVPTYQIFIAVSMVLFWLPGVGIILTGHLSPIIILLLLVGLQLVINGQDTTAGLILALTASSFPISGLLLIILLIYSISRRRWSIISSFFSGLLFLSIISWLVFPAWFLSWLSLLFSTFDSWEWIHTPLMDFAALLPGLAPSLSIFLHTMMGVYAIFLMVTVVENSDRAFVYNIFGILVIAYFLHINASTYYLMLVIPGMFLVFRYLYERWGLLGKIFSWAVLIIISGGSWLLFIENINFTTTHWIPLLSIGFPIFVFVGLIWIRWWAVRIPKLPYDI